MPDTAAGLRRAVQEPRTDSGFLAAAAPRIAAGALMTTGLAVPAETSRRLLLLQGCQNPNGASDHRHAPKCGTPQSPEQAIIRSGERAPVRLRRLRVILAGTACSGTIGGCL